MDLLNKIAANVSVDKIRNLAEDAINQAKPKTDVEARVYEALSHKNWGSSSTLMNEIARDTFDYDRFSVVTMILWESLSNPRPAAWRVVFKGLSLLEHLIKNGSERCVDDSRNHSHILRHLHNFNYYEGTIDRGVGVREKSKQLVELLADDERIREERLKAKQLREKFGGNLGGVSNMGSMQGIGGGGSGGGSSYPGYGNNSNDSNYGGYHGSGSYGNSGIGSSGGFQDSDDKGYSGRYSEENNATVSPTFATLPEKKTKKKSGKKTKKKDKTDSSGPDIDLLALDDDILPAASNSDSFDAFQSAGGDEDNGFDAFQSAPTQNVSDNFDAFGSMQQPQQQVFDAFGANPPPSQPSFDAFGTTNAIAGDMNDMFGNMNVGGMNSSNSTTRPIMGGNAAVVSGGLKAIDHSNEDDEFGDFDDGTSGKNINKSSDPLANLISLDSLTKNTKKQDKTNEPIAFNDAAKQFIEKGPSVKPVTMSKEAANMAFSGVDGLPKHHAAPMMQMNTMNAGNKPSVMMSGAGSNANAIDSVFPDIVAQKAEQQRQMMMMQQQQRQMMMMQQQQQQMMQQQYQMSSMPTSMGSMGNNTMRNNRDQQEQSTSMGGSQFSMNSGMSPMGGQGMGTSGIGGQSMQGWR
jgi:epsin